MAKKKQKPQSDLKAFEQAVRKWQQRFQMQNWDITVDMVGEFTDSSCIAEGEWSYGESWARIKLAHPTTGGFIPNDTALHEILHIMHAPLTVRYKEMVRKFVPQAVAERFIEEWNTEDERVVRQLVRGILHDGKRKLPEGAS